MLKIEERGEELKVPHHASAAAARDSNLPHVKATCLTLRQLASNNSHLPLFPTVAAGGAAGVNGSTVGKTAVVSYSTASGAVEVSKLRA